MTRVSAILAALAVVVGLSAGGWFAMRPSNADPFAPCRTAAVAGGTATIGGPFALTDGAGRRVTDAEAITGPTLVYFGYSFCPDVCPMDLSRNALAAAELAERGTEGGAGLHHHRPGPRHARGGARLHRGDRSRRWSG